MIQLNNISKKYNGESVLTNFSLQINDGETTVLIGPSGCGKSTVMRIITGLTTPSDGVVLFEDQEFHESNLLNIRRNTGYVIQEGGLFPHLTAFDNVIIMAKHLEWAEADIENRVEQLCTLTNLKKELLINYPAQLSGGQRQRISLMRALMLDPNYLLLDEPLGALDPLIRFDLQNDLREIFKRLNKTVFMVTHDLAEAVFFADKIVLMKEGEIVQIGEPGELIKNPVNDFVKEFINAQRGHLEN